MDTAIDEPTEARPLFYPLPFLSFLSNGVKGRVPTFPRAIDRYLHNSGALAAHRAQERRRTFPFRVAKKKEKEKEKENNCPLLIKSLYRRIIMNFLPSGTEPPEALRLSESALFIAFDSNIYPPRVYSEIPPASVLAARLIPLMLFILCFLLCFRHAVTLLAGRSVYTKGFASEFYRILRRIHRAPQQRQQERRLVIFRTKFLQRAANVVNKNRRMSLIRREATE